MIEIVNIKEKIDSNGTGFKVLTLRNYTTVDSKRIYGHRLANLAVYPNGQNDLFFRKRGSLLVGTIVTRKVEPYFIGDKECRVCTYPVFFDPESPCFEEAVRYTFERRGKKLEMKRSELPNHRVLG